MKPDDRRRRALQLARDVTTGNAPLVTPPSDVHLIATALLALYEAGRERHMPVYHASLCLVRDDGTQDPTAWPQFKTVVMRCRECEKGVQ